MFEYKVIKGEMGGGGGGGVKIGHHRIGAWAEIGQNGIRGGWGVKKTQKTSDIIYARSLILLQLLLLFQIYFLICKVTEVIIDLLVKP